MLSPRNRGGHLLIFAALAKTAGAAKLNAMVSDPRPPSDPSAGETHQGHQVQGSSDSRCDMDTDRVILSNPYPLGNFPGLELDPLETDQDNLPPVAEQPMRSLPEQTTMEEPSPYATQSLVDAFLGRFSGGGFFFLDPHEFRRAALLPVPFHHPARPSPGLLSTVYLWGTHIISASGRQPVHEYAVEDLLAMTVYNLAHDIHVSGPLVHQREFLSQTIQSEVLLSLWFLHIGHPLLGRYYCATAAALVSAHDTSLPRVISLNVSESMETTPPLCAVFVLERIWLAVSALSTTPPGVNLNLNAWHTTNQSTALPLPSSTFQAILEQLEAHDVQAPFTLLANAALLFERSIILSDGSACQRPESFQFPGDPSSPNFHDTAEFHGLDEQIDALQRSLRPMVGAECALPVNQTLLVARALTNMATMQLHASRLPGSVESIHRSFFVAGQIVDDILVLGLRDGNHVAAIWGPLLFALCNFYISQYHIGDTLHIIERVETLLGLLADFSKFSPMICKRSTSPASWNNVNPDEYYIAAQQHYHASEMSFLISGLSAAEKASNDSSHASMVL
ncbi:hypothetical protein C8R45DRAFT_1124488 [Mycena sanguinolenta]|nr:hypothetical protein C8R45DRAFT_1124488 [Mycena sanguinolenta]